MCAIDFGYECEWSTMTCIIRFTVLSRFPIPQTAVSITRSGINSTKAIH
uniref:Uncharacterized protein n=1 Tax=Arundo donax TaxID=35708 RepID=A0A0A9DRX8_ARUDO